MNPRGFTLIELIVAISLLGIEVVLAGAVFGHVQDSGVRLARSNAEQTRAANARTWLAEWVSQLEIGAPESPGIRGSEHGVSFDSWTWEPSGERQRARVTVTFADGVLRAEGVAAGTVVLADGLEGAVFDYRAAYGSAATFVSYWDSRLEAPLEVRIRLVRPATGGQAVDTMLFVVGARS